MWAFGCILAEMALLQRLFDGRRIDQLWENFVNVLGTPDLEAFLTADQVAAIPNQLVELFRNMGQRPAQRWSHVFPPSVCFAPTPAATEGDEEDGGGGEDGNDGTNYELWSKFN
jgi:hypothetical protein